MYRFNLGSSYIQSLFRIKGIACPKMKILSLCTHHHVVLNLQEFLSFVEHKIRYFEKCLSFSIQKKKKNLYYGHSSKHLFVSQKKIKSTRFRTTRVHEWINDDRIFIFGWTPSLNLISLVISPSLSAHSFRTMYLKGLYALFSVVL